MTITAQTVTERGVSTSQVALPSLIWSALRSCCSAAGPRMTPITAGSTGSPYRHMPNPITPLPVDRLNGPAGSVARRFLRSFLEPP